MSRFCSENSHFFYLPILLGLYNFYIMANSCNQIPQERVEQIIATLSAAFDLPGPLLEIMRDSLETWGAKEEQTDSYKEPDWWRVPQTVKHLAVLLNCSRGTIYNRLEELGEDVATLKDASGRVPPEVVRILATMRRDKRASHHYVFQNPDINLKNHELRITKR